jgi:amino acid transporter
MDTLLAILKYLFSPVPGPAFQFYNILIAFSILLIIGAVAVSIIYRKRRKYDFAFKRLFKRLSSTMTTFGFLFLFLIAVRYENIPYFAMRFFLYLTALIFLYFVYRYAKKFKVDYPKERENFERNASTGKNQNIYLPNKKRR